MMQEFAQQITNTIREALKNVHTAMPGRILAYDTNTGLATVLPVVKMKLPNGERVDYPQITGVPVLMPNVMSQDVTIAFPVTVGQDCLILVSEQSMDYWMYGHETPGDLQFDLTNAICIPGLFRTVPSAVKEASEKNAVILKAKETKITVQNGSVSIDAPSIQLNGNVAVNGDFTVRNGIVNLN